jgi:hypothetical protein
MARIPLEQVAYACAICGWERRRGMTAEWQNQVIDHPIYGRVSNARLVTLDISTHNCDAHMSTIYRLHEADRRRCEAAA